MLILVLFSMITSSTSQLNSRRRPLGNEIMISPLHKPTFRRLAGRDTTTFAVVNSFPNLLWNRPTQNLQQRSATDRNAVDGFGMRNDASILAGNMSSGFIKEISEYLYDLLKDESSTQRRHKSRPRNNSIRKSSEIMDYEDETRFLEAKNRSRNRTMAVVHSHRTRLNVPLVDHHNGATLIGMSRQKPNLISARILAHSHRRGVRSYGIA